MKRRIIGGVLLLVALCAVAYPLISNKLSQRKHDEIIVEYTNTVTAASSQEQAAVFSKADEYNKRLHSGGSVSTDEYNSLMNINNDGIMGVLEIPCISVKLPIYHGTSESSLQRGIGHLYGTSLPTGKSGTHTALSGHSGMAGQKMLTDLVELEEGDIFKLHILNETFVYKIDSIKKVLPHETGHLIPTGDDDRVTLITCVPYGVNSHRLLVSGIRMSDEEIIEKETSPSSSKDDVTKASGWESMYYMGIALGGIIAMIFVFIWMIVKRHKCYLS